MCDGNFASASTLIPSTTPSRSAARGVPLAAFANFLHAAVFDIALPAAIYTLSFFALTYPLICQFSNAFYCGRGDGVQNEWNLWWVRKVILDLHQSPWFTTWLHAPYGTTLVGHTLNPINGLIGIPLSLIFSRIQVYNLIVIGCFVSSGITAFWLARHITKSYVPGLFGGFAFTFTGYHFAHAYGHMQLISMEFIPLFLLAWLRMLEQPGYARAATAGIVLGLVGLCDLNYVFYSVLAGSIAGAFHLPHLAAIAHSQRPRYLLRRFAVFIAISSICCGPLLISLLWVNSRDPLLGSHDAVEYSADALAVLIPGGADLLGHFTQRYWSSPTTNIPEQSVYVGWTALAMAIYGLCTHRRKGSPAHLWFAIAAVSYLLSLGPVLHICGVPVTGAVMPFAWLTRLLPSLQLSGCPGRISIMFALAISMLLSLGIAQICRQRDRISRAFLPVFAILVAVDLCPRGLPTNQPDCPRWTTVLRDLPRHGAVISNVGDLGQELFQQTLYDRPMAFGYVSRLPKSVDTEDRQIAALARAHDFAALSRMGFAYLVLPPDRKLPDLPLVYSDDEVNIQELP